MPVSKIKIGFWILCAVSIGIFLVSSIFNWISTSEYRGVETLANVNTIIEKIEIKEPDFVTLVFGGDVMLARGVRNSVIKNLGGDYFKLFEQSDIANILRKADIAFINLEGVVSDKGRDMGSIYSFRMDPLVLPALVSAGIDVISVSNNHVGDWGREAYSDMLARLKEKALPFSGGGMNKEEAVLPVIIEKHGIKIGFLAFSDVGPAWVQATEEKAGPLMATDPRFKEIIKNASAQVDYLVVSFHFGEEYKTVHNKRQEELAHQAIDAGAKLVIGHHPHVIQDSEVYSPKDCTQSSCMGYIAYSLGNFIFDQSWSEPTMQGMLLEITLNKDGAMYVRKNTTKLNGFFQLEEIERGEEEEIEF